MSLVHDITVVIVDEQKSLKEVGAIVRRTKGSCMVVLPPGGWDGIAVDQQHAWFRELRSLHADRTLTLATKNKEALDSASQHMWDTVSTIKHLRFLLKGHKAQSEAVRIFSPSSWRRDIRTQLQFVGLLSLPKLRIWVLLGVSLAIFLFAFLRLLPSSTVKVWANQNTVDYTMNVLLVSSGAVLPPTFDRIHRLVLYPLTLTIDRTMTFDEVGKDFTGQNASVLLTVFNDANERYSLRKGTRFTNQAGMVFKIQGDLILDAHTKQVVRAVADAVDLYGEIVGERGNVPAGVKWEISKLPESERKLIYGRNEKPATGGRTSYANVLKKEDILIARKKLEQELKSAAKQMAEDETISRSNDQGRAIVQLRYDDLTSFAFKNFDLSESFVGQNVSSIPIQGSIVYKVLLYDKDALLELLRHEIKGHVSAEKKIVENSVSKENIDLHIVAPWDDNLNWVKVTADLTYTEKFVLSPITPTGATFGKYVRDHIAGKSVEDAERIIKNLPEVSKVDIRMWPPWATRLPDIGSSIAIQEQ